MHKNISICIIVSIFLLISCPITITSNNTTNTNQNSSDNNNTNDNSGSTNDGGGSGGSNTQTPPSDPIIIDSAEDLQLLAKYPTGNFEITTNIDMKDKPFTPIPNFGGTINGKQHTISNLTYKVSEGSKQIMGGFITATSGNVVITQLMFDKIDIKAEFTDRSFLSYSLGGLFGKLNHNLTLREVGVSGNVGGTVSTGGIIGSAGVVSVHIENCYFVLTIKSTKTPNAINLPSIGGIIREAKHGVTIKNTIVLGSMSNEEKTFGQIPTKEVLIQWSTPQTGQPPNDKLHFENVYSAVEDVEKARFLNPDPASADSAIHTGINKVGELKNIGIDSFEAALNGVHQYNNVGLQASYKNWDFTNIWKISTGGSPQPVFQWQ